MWMLILHEEIIYSKNTFFVNHSHKTVSSYTSNLTGLEMMYLLWDASLKCLQIHGNVFDHTFELQHYLLNIDTQRYITNLYLGMFRKIQSPICKNFTQD